jgi:hypothetical protein
MKDGELGDSMSRGEPVRSIPHRNRTVELLLVLGVAAIALGSYAALPGTASRASLAPSSGHGGAAAPLAHSAKPTSAPTPHVATPTPRSSSNWQTPHVQFQVPGPHPQSWGTSTPPGAPTPVNPADGNADGVNWTQLEQRCYGVWPTRGGQAQYYASCYGHDEPGLAPYSQLAGSGGNVTWQIQLPVDRSPTQNQSNLYSAIWFGMTLNDPYAWMNQCFLELQFYPDSTWTAPTSTVDGLWVGAAVAWQIEASTGAENPCFYAALTVQGSPGSFFTMTQGDSINVTMSGWIGSSTGELLTITDTSSGQVSSLTLYNASANYPLNPSYSTDSWSNALWWTPGGETPVSFAFETGHAGNPSIPSNNTFGGCSPGVPPPTALDGAVPCPSYDPASWANDTLLPWQIAAPTFFNSTQRETTTQVGFTQDLGGLAFIDGSDLFGSFPYTCLGHETSGHCGYPWYSYSCSTSAYNFGATDYPTTSADFGKSTEFTRNATSDGAGLGYYMPTNFTVPACGAPTATVSVSSPTGGTATFLNATVGTTIRAFRNIPYGNYSLAAWAAPGSVFTGWATSGGGVVVSAPSDSYTNVAIRGSGTIQPTFALSSLLSGAATNVTFTSTTPGTRFSIVAGYAATGFGLGPMVGTIDVTAGTTVPLLTGLYTIQAQPPPGYNFTGWSVSSTFGSVSIASPKFPVTVLDLPDTGGTANVTAAFVSSPTFATVEVFTPNSGETVVLNGTNYSSFAIAALRVGTYSLSYRPAAGERFWTWSAGGSSILTNFSSSTWISFEAGTSVVEPDGFAIQLVTLNETGGYGTITWNPDSNKSAQAVPNGTTLPVNVSAASFPSFSIVATPAAGWSFAGWYVSNRSVAFFSNPLSYSTHVIFNTTGVTAVTINARFALGATAHVGIHATPAAGGLVSLGFAPPVGNGSTLLAPTGAVFVSAVPSAGYVVTGITADNGSLVSLVRGASPVTTPWTPSVWIFTIARNTTLNATFAPLRYPVTFVANSPTGSPTATINGTVVGQGGTVWLPNGTYSLSTSLGSGVTFGNWTPSWSTLTVGSPGSASTQFNVTGPGTLYALGTVVLGPVLVENDLFPAAATLLPGGTLPLVTTVICLSHTACPPTVTYAWSLTNPLAGSLNRSTGSTVRFTAANVYDATGILVNATLNGTTVESIESFLSVLPALTGVSVRPASSSIFAGQSVGFAPTLTCTAGVTCPLGATFGGSLGSPSLGLLSSNLTFPVTFSAYPGVSGMENITINTTLNSVTVVAYAQVTVALPLLTSVAILPLSVSTPVGTVTNFTATPGCSAGLVCPAGAAFTWAVAPSTLGTLSTMGAAAEFTAGASPGSGTVNVSTTLHGVTISGVSVAVVVTASTGALTLTSVTISPSALSLAVGAVGQFTATPSCTPSPCPSDVAIAWALSGNVGSVSPLSGASTNVMASHVGSGELYANATFSGRTLSATPAPISVTSAGSSSSSTPIYDNPLLWVAIVVVAVVAVAAIFLMRRGAPGSGSGGGSGGSTSAPPPGATK